METDSAMRRSLTAVLSALMLAAGACAPPAPDKPHRLVFLIESNPFDKRATIFIDAIDAKGGHGLNADTGRPYPADYSRELPFRHTVAYGPGDVLTVRVEAIVAGVPGDLLSCSITDRGVKIERPQPRPFDQVPDGAISAAVVCIYTTSGV